MASLAVDERIVARVFALLRELEPDVKVFRAREDAITREECPAVVVKPSDKNPAPFGGEVERVELMFNVEIYARDTAAESGQPAGEMTSWDANAAAVAVQVHAALMKDRTLGGLVAPIRAPEEKWDGDEGDATPGKRTMTYKCIYLSMAADLTAQP